MLTSAESGQPGTAPEWPWRGKKISTKTRRKAMADYLTPGNVIEGYGGERQRVVAFDPKANSITVEPVEQRGGEWVGTGERRTHGTWPADRELQRGPLVRASSPIDAAASNPDQKADPQQSLVEAAAPRQPGAEPIKKSPAPQKRPLMAYVTQRLGGINPTGRIADELRVRGVNARTAPGLWRRGGHKDLDNVPAGDHPVHALPVQR
ncbi:MAG: hypothetical protein Q4615_14170 [Paracoccus aminovorans]|nr:hypothetical protein [Paracoccus aminovorans]